MGIDGKKRLNGGSESNVADAASVGLRKFSIRGRVTDAGCVGHIFRPALGTRNQYIPGLSRKFFEGIICSGVLGDDHFTYRYVPVRGLLLC